MFPNADLASVSASGLGAAVGAAVGAVVAVAGAAVGATGGTAVGGGGTGVGVGAGAHAASTTIATVMIAKKRTTFILSSFKVFCVEPVEFTHPCVFCILKSQEFHKKKINLAVNLQKPARSEEARFLARVLSTGELRESIGLLKTVL